MATPLSAADAVAPATAPGVRLDPDHLGGAARQRQRDPADAAVGVDHALGRSDRQRVGDRGVGQSGDLAVRLEEGARREQQAHGAARDVDLIFDLADAVEETFVLALRVGEDRVAARAVLVLDDADDLGAGRAKSARQRGAVGQRAGDDPDGQHAPVVIRAQHDVAQVAGQRRLVVGADAGFVEESAQRGGGLVERRLGDPAAGEIDDVVRARCKGAQDESIVEPPSSRRATTSFDRFR